MPVRLEIGHDTETGINVLSTSTLNNGKPRNRQYISSKDIMPPQTLSIDLSPNTIANEYRNGNKNKMDLKLVTNGIERQSQTNKLPSDFLPSNNDFNQKEFSIDAINQPNVHNTSTQMNGKTIGQIHGNPLEYSYSNGITNTKLKTNLLANVNTLNGNNLLTNSESIEGKFNLRTFYNIRACVIISFAYYILCSLYCV